jgi:hypothetical protein
MQTDPDTLGITIMGGVFILFPLLWIFVCYVLSWSGGWRKLAKRFRATELKGEPHYLEGAIVGRIGLFGGASYRGCLTIRIHPEGLGLSVWFIFRAGHPPLFIPWKELRFIGEEKFFWFRFSKYQVGDPKITYILFYSKGTEEQIRARVTGSRG